MAPMRVLDTHPCEAGTEGGNPEYGWESRRAELDMDRYTNPLLNRIDSLGITQINQTVRPSVLLRQTVRELCTASKRGEIEDQCAVGFNDVSFRPVGVVFGIGFLKQVTGGDPAILGPGSVSRAFLASSGHRVS